MLAHYILQPLSEINMISEDDIHTLHSLHDDPVSFARALEARIMQEPTGDTLVEGMYQKMWKDFVSLQRGDAKQICVEAELYRKTIASPIPPTGWQPIETAPKGEMFIWALPKGDGKW